MVVYILNVLCLLITFFKVFISGARLLMEHQYFLSQCLNGDNPNILEQI